MAVMHSLAPLLSVLKASLGKIKFEFLVCESATQLGMRTDRVRHREHHKQAVSTFRRYLLILQMWLFKKGKKKKHKEMFYFFALNVTTESYCTEITDSLYLYM